MFILLRSVTSGPGVRHRAAARFPRAAPFVVSEVEPGTGHGASRVVRLRSPRTGVRHERGASCGRVSVTNGGGVTNRPAGREPGTGAEPRTELSSERAPSRGPGGAPCATLSGGRQAADAERGESRAHPPYAKSVAGSAGASPTGRAWKNRSWR